MIFLLLCSSWSCTSQQSNNSTAKDDNSTESSESFTTQPIELETKPAVVGEAEVAQALVQEPETVNAIDGQLTPTKKPKRPNRQQHHKHENGGAPPLTISWPYFPTPAQIPYPIAYAAIPPMYYPMPIYSPYFFPPHMYTHGKPIENVSPANIERMDTSDSEMETMSPSFLKIGNFWDHEMKFGNKTQGNKNGTINSKPPNRFPIRNWIKNKLDKKNENENPDEKP